MGKRGEKMSLDAVRRVARSEQEAQEWKTVAAAQAKRILADAQQEGQRRVDQARSRAEEQVADLLVQVETEAAARAEAARAANREECQRLRREAEGRLAQAAGLIVERIGEI